jgi:hypothetical protein
MMKDKNRVFSVELDSKKDLKNITLENWWLLVLRKK